MKAYQNFTTAAYVYAYYLEEADEEQIQRGIDYYRQYFHLDKVYLENHRGLVDISKERMRWAKEIFEKNGIQTSGGITSTGLVNGERKPSIFDTYCFTDPAHRAEYQRIVQEIAEVFDEIILDDYFFTACRCEQCIRAKGKQTWAQYRLKLMENFSREIVDLAKKVNPRVNFIIKYPNWYESYQETGYNPEKQKDIFDMIYAGTESRDPIYASQHIQRYLSYSMVRLMENTAPGRNGGGWFDLGGSGSNMNYYVEQAELTAFAKARELMLFNFESMIECPALGALGQRMKRVDQLMSHTGKPMGVMAYEPYNGDGEDQLYNYLGMCGIPFEPTPDLPKNAPVVFFTASSACDPDIMKKTEEYVRNGGNAVVTVGFFHKTYDQGIRDMTSVRLTNRHVSGREYLIDNCQFDYSQMESTCGIEDVTFEALDYKTNATWSNLTLLVNEDNYPVFTEDNYGRGRLFILNVPENFADLYKLPAKITGNIAKIMTMGLPVYISSQAKYNLYQYDNNVFGIFCYHQMKDTCRIVVRGEHKGIQNLETGERYTEKIKLISPMHRGDSCTCVEEPEEYAIEVPMFGGQYAFYKLI